MKKQKKLYILFLFFSFFVKGWSDNTYKIHIEVINDTLLVVNLKLDISEDYQTQTHFLFSDWTKIIDVEVNGKPTIFSMNRDTLFFSGLEKISSLKMKYKVPLLRFADAAILRRENGWFPHRRNELFRSELTISDTSQHIITNGIRKGNTFLSPLTYEIHLLLLPKQNYAVKEMSSQKRSFRFFRHKNDTSLRSDFFYSEFLNSYDFFSSFFDDDARSHMAMNVVEIYDRNFMMAQSLENLILFGNFFYWRDEQDGFLCSWIPHEIAHQWWGNRVFFKFSDTMRLFLEESLTEFLKIQYIQSQRGIKGLSCIKEIYEWAMEEFENLNPISEINSLNSNENVVVVYTQVPFLLNEIQNEFQ